MIPASQVETMIGTLQDQIREMAEALAQAKRVIAKLQAALYGTRAETSAVVLTAEGQQVIDPLWLRPQEVTPAPAAPSRESVTRTPRDRRGLAQRYPGLKIEETQAAIPAELADAVASGALMVTRSTRYQDELVLPKGRPFLRRVFAIDLVKAGSNIVALQLSQDRIVPGGDLADETIHGFVEGKALDATPFHRQLAQAARVGVDIPKQTVNDAVNAWGDLFAPLAATIAAQVIAADIVHADASWERLQAKGACKRLNLWTRLGAGQVVYSITDDQTHARAGELIPSTFAGKLVTDAWPGWFKLLLGDRLALCNAHARRPFADWLKRNPDHPHARRIVDLYRQLYRLEHEADKAPSDERRERRGHLRDTKSRAIMANILAEAETIAASYSHSHQLADGARYLLDYRDGLTRFLDDPTLPLDNNAAENALRINALIRKNSLFVGSRAAADRDAVALTIFHSCKLQGLVPADYLARVTPTLLRHRSGRSQDLENITPARIARGG